MPWQFRVVDGADQGRVFPLPEAGIFPVGSSRKHAEIVLNDLYVARIHAEVELDGPRVVITDHDSPGGMQVNGQKAKSQEIHHGDVVRMGNSHLRLEDVDTAAQEAPPVEEDLPAYEVEELPDEGAEMPIIAEPVMAEPVVAEPVVAEPVLAEAVVVEGVDESGAAGLVAAAASAEVVLSEQKAQALPADRLRELEGHTLAHFQIGEVIGVGHSSLVFQALDLQRGVIIALKVLSPEFPQNDAELQRFLEVSKTVMPLRHPNLVSVYGVGKSGPYCWLATKRIEAASLPSVIQRLAGMGAIDWHGGYRVAVQIGRALAFAHGHGILHSNITARHILWSTHEKVARLANLGMAAALQGSNLQKVTLRYKLQSDLPYFAPEKTEPETYLDGACDIYGLGVVVYALLTGRYPFLGSSQAELIRNIREARPIAPTTLRPEVPRALEAIVLRMLAKRPEERYETADDLLANLQAFGEKQGVQV